MPPEFYKTTLAKWRRWRCDVPKKAIEVYVPFLRFYLCEMAWFIFKIWFVMYPLLLLSVTHEKSFDLGNAHGRYGGSILTLSKL
jgi:hypothetical protein